VPREKISDYPQTHCLLSDPVVESPTRVLKVICGTASKRPAINGHSEVVEVAVDAVSNTGKQRPSERRTGVKKL